MATTDLHSEKSVTVKKTTGRQSLSWLWLLCAAAMLLVADGRNTIALAAWLAPAALLRFVRTQPAARGLLFAYATLLVTRGIAFRGMIPIPGVFYYIFLVISCVSGLLPYVADRMLARYFSGVANTLLFPCTLVVTQFIYSRGPMGSWGSIPYTQTGNLPLLQLLSVTGLWGITFLIGWFAATANWTWQQKWNDRSLRPLVLFGATLFSVLLCGAARLAVFPPSSRTVRVASLSPNNGGPVISDELLKAVTAGRATESQINQFRSASRESEDRLMIRSATEAAAGAKIVFWAETALFILKQDEVGAIARGQVLASKSGIYLGMALGTWTPGAIKPLENKLVLIDPAGQVAWQYVKARPTPGPETAMAVKTDGRLRAVDTPFGGLTGAICYDMDFPPLLAQAPALRTSLVLSPAGDWRAIDPRHTEMASFRAIEQGFNVVRQSKGGLSAAYDYQGHRLAAMDEYQAADLTMVAQVPVRGVRTIYSRAGDWLAWLCVSTLIALLGAAWRRSRPSATATLPS